MIPAIVRAGFEDVGSPYTTTIDRSATRTREKEVDTTYKKKISYGKKEIYQRYIGSIHDRRRCFPQRLQFALLSILEIALYESNHLAMYSMYASTFHNTKFILCGMYPWMALEFFRLIEDSLPDHYHGIPPIQQFLSVVRFLADGAYQKDNANDWKHPMSQATFSQYLHIVIPAINALANQYIHFPQTREERETVQEGFEQRSGIPGINGAIECMLVNIFTPDEHEEQYFDRKNNHSLNAQMMRLISLRPGYELNIEFIWNCIFDKMP
ncbi:hypothetical protein QAD02_002476 [Eretmocerus hayati]|uniref:Uncharacterized protein n=1 Tax=Eretmocerus hayati TaxID=131215 RepID=A0ACC2NLW7_9HYME|nr:hypothetical protein QAD02_002476 [Eretmocerus hayati]